MPVKQSKQLTEKSQQSKRSVFQMGPLESVNIEEIIPNRKRSLMEILAQGYREQIEERYEEDELSKLAPRGVKEKFLKEKNKAPLPRLMLRYNSKFRMNWDLLVMLLAVYNCVVIPFSVAYQPEATTGFNVWERFVDVLFGIDVICNFRTSFVNEKTGFEIVDNRTVALHYIKSGRFFVDFAASLPLELIINSGSSNSKNSKNFKLLGLLKLVRLLRLGRIIRYMKLRQGFKLGMRLLQLFLLMIFLVHWISCLWFLLIRNEGDWIPPRYLDYKNPGDDISIIREYYYLDLLSKYFLTYYYGILILTGNEIAPRNAVQTVVATMVIIVGTIVSAFIFGNMAAIMGSLNKKSSAFDAQMDMVNTTMRSMRIPEDMQD